jgi:hypothetical protein
MIKKNECTILIKSFSIFHEKGKLNRGFSVIQTYKLLKDGEDMSEEEFFLAGVLGWSLEWAS